jgi:small neutral amino acid transporter SnatA (MarC family)
MNKEYFLENLFDIAFYIVFMMVIAVIVNLLKISIEWQLPVYGGIILASVNGVNRRIHKQNENIDEDNAKEKEETL